MKIGNLFDPEALKKSLRDQAINKALIEPSKTNIAEVLTDKKDAPIDEVLNQKDSIGKVVAQPEPEIICRLYKGHIFDSFSVKEDFTNFLPEKMYFTSETEGILDKIKKDKTTVYLNYDRKEPPAVTYSGQHKEHIKKVVEEFEKISSTEDNDLVSALINGRIRKSTVMTNSQKGNLRIISLYEKDIANNKTYFDFLFPDFYHMFVPSRHLGIDAYKTLRRVYNDYKNNSTSIKEVLSENEIEWIEKDPTLDK